MYNSTANVFNRREITPVKLVDYITIIGPGTQYLKLLPTPLCVGHGFLKSIRGEEKSDGMK
jgi:hypothetical protein